MRRAAVALLAVLVLGGAAAAVFRSGEAACRRLRQTAELAPGSTVRPTAFGGRRVDSAALFPGPVEAAVVVIEPVREAAVTPAPPPRRPFPDHAGPTFTVAQVEAERTPALAQCLDSGAAARGVSVAMGGCVNAELALQDARLDAAYRKAMAQLDDAGRARLRAEELDWIRRRDSQCAEQATGGTIDMVDVPACRLDETISRRLTLDALLR
jgi:uncharacterized protein YecT (DUF1311 family)